MKSSSSKIQLTPFDELFTTEETREDPKREKVMEIPLEQLYQIIMSIWHFLIK